MINHSTYTLHGSNNKPMAADLSYEDKPEQPLILYAHGINGFKDWGGMKLVAQTFADAGFAFLKFNFSHNGTTPEQPEEFADLEAYGQDNYGKRQYDLKQVVDFVLDGNLPFKVSQVYLLGHSRGGTDAILYARTDKRISKLMTWSAVSAATTPWRKWDSATMHQWKAEGVHYLENKRTGQKLPVYYQLFEDYRQHKQNYDLEQAARKISIPWLICHGSEDESVFIKDAYDLKSWAANARVKIVENTGHTYGRSHPWKEDQLPAATTELIEACIAFLKA